MHRRLPGIVGSCGKPAPVRIVRELRVCGLIDVDARSRSGPASEPFGPWLSAFWKYDGAYIRERLAHGQRATRRHCQDMEGRAREIEAMLPPTLVLGEVLALQRQDIGKDRLFIRHSYSIRDGLKSPKNGGEREVPLLPAVRSAFLALEAKSPTPPDLNDSSLRGATLRRQPARMGTNPRDRSMLTGYSLG